MITETSWTSKTNFVLLVFGTFALKLNFLNDSRIVIRYFCRFVG